MLKILKKNEVLADENLRLWEGKSGYVFILFLKLLYSRITYKKIKFVALVVFEKINFENH